MSIADDKAIEAMTEQLETMLMQMAVPELRRDVRGEASHSNLAWLSRNLGINNPKNPNLHNALEATHWLLRNRFHRND